MARIRPVLVVTDVPANGTGAPVVNQVASATYVSMTWDIGKPESVSYRATGQDAVDHLTPGRPPPGTRIVGPSLDAGAHQDTRMLSTGCQVANDTVPYVSESGSGLGQVLATGGVERKSVQQVSLRDVLTAKPNQMRMQAGPSNTLLPSNRLPVTAGLQYEPIGPAGTTQAAQLAFTYVVDPQVANLVLDLDANRDSPLRGLDTIAAHMGSLLADVQRAQYAIDSGDYGVVEGRTVARTVTVGHKGAVSRFRFDGKTLTRVPQMVLHGTAGGAQTTDMCYSAAFKGGDTRWGMPDGGAITSIRTTARTWPASDDLRIGMPIVGVYADRDHGGVMAWIGDGELHPLSQAMGVTDLWYDETLGESYAATDAGVYHLSGDLKITAQESWIRVGSMALKVSKLCKDGGILYALCAFKDGSAHILQYPAAVGTPTGHGYDGWSAVYTHTGLADFAVSAGVLYWISNASGADGKVYRHQIGAGDLKPLPIPFVAVAGDVVATGLDAITNLDNGSEVIGIFVRTSQGSKGLYYIDGITAPFSRTVSLFYAGAGLVDALKAPVRVNRITGHSATQVKWADGQFTTVHVWAATNRGVYASVLAVGSFNWRRTDGQGNLGDVEVQAVASAPPRKYLGQTQTRVWAITPGTILESDDGTLHFTDMLARKLDAGPAFYALWKKAHGDYPTLADTTLKYPSPKTGPYQVIRSLHDDNTGQYSYKVVNPKSTAPGWAHRFHESPQHSTGSLVSEIRGSQLLIDAMVRFLAYTADAQLVLDVDSYFRDDTDPLRFLRPTHLVTLDASIVLHVASPITFVSYDNERFYVLSHNIVVDGAADPGIARTRTRIATLLLDSRADPERIISDMWNAISRQTLYAKGR